MESLWRFDSIGRHSVVQTLVLETDGSAEADEADDSAKMWRWRAKREVINLEGASFTECGRNEM